MSKTIEYNGYYYDVDLETEDYADFLIDELYVGTLVKGVSDDAKTQKSIREIIRKVVTDIVSNFDFIRDGVEDYAEFDDFVEERYREEFAEQVDNDDI